MTKRSTRFSIEEHSTASLVLRPGCIDGVLATSFAFEFSGSYPYDFLVSALGSRVVPEAIDGLAERLAEARHVHTFYTPDGAVRLAKALDGFSGGRLVISIAEMPIKCPVAPIEFTCLAESYL